MSDPATPIPADPNTDAATGNALESAGSAPAATAAPDAPAHGENELRDEAPEGAADASAQVNEPHPAENAGAAPEPPAADTGEGEADKIRLGRDITVVAPPADGSGGEGGKVEVREAVIYFPGLAQNAASETPGAVARRIARAMDNNSPARRAGYTVASGQNASFDGISARTAAVKPGSGAPAGAVQIDVFEFDYRLSLVDGFEKRPPLAQAWQIFATLVANFGNFVAAAGRRGQCLKQKLQVLYAGLLVGGLFVYMVMLLCTVAVTSKEAAGKVVANAYRERITRDSVRIAKDSVRIAQDSVKLAKLGEQTGSAGKVAGKFAKPQEQPERATGSVIRLRVGNDSTIEVRVAAPGSKAAREAGVTGIQPSRSDSAGRAPRAREDGGVLQSVRTWFGRLVSGVWGVVTWPFMLLAGVLGDLLGRVWRFTEARLFWMQTGVISASFLGMVFRLNVKNVLARVSAETTCAANYLAYGKGRNEVLGQLSRLLDHVGSRDGVRYRNVHLVGYSFGSVVAMDAVFQDSEVNETFRQVTTLSTIACPADFIRTYWRRYFVARHTLHGPELRWVNVYAKSDVLASNFVDAGRFTFGYNADEGTATEKNGRGTGVDLARAPGPEQKHRLPDMHVHFGPPAPRGFLGWFFFTLAADGFKAHNCYWDASPTATGKTCWEPLMKRIYGYHPQEPGATAVEKEAPALAAAAA